MTTEEMPAWLREWRNQEAMQILEPIREGRAGDLDGRLVIIYYSTATEPHIALAAPLQVREPHSATPEVLFRSPGVPGVWHPLVEYPSGSYESAQCVSLNCIDRETTYPPEHVALYPRRY